MSRLWRPDTSRIQGAQLTEFAARFDLPGATSHDYAALHRWSLDHSGAFWGNVWDYCAVIGERSDEVFVAADDLREARFFPDAKLNFARNLLRRDDDSLALICRAEEGEPRYLTWAELAHESRRFAGYLTEQGVGAGDHVVALMPNVAETVIAALGAATVGAVFSSASPDFGAAAALDRFGPLEPSLLIACDGYRYNGRTFDCRDKVHDIARALPTLRGVVVVRCAGLDAASSITAWADAVDCSPADFLELPFDHPLYVMFTSGTTGKPKAIVHGAGGTLLQHLKEHRLQCDIRAGDRAFYFTTCGWMMWNWLISALGSEATLVLYDGSPSHPDMSVLFDMVDREQVTFFGTSAKFIDAVKKSGLEPRESHDFASIRTIASTGSPLVPESFDFVYRSIKSDVQLASISGGTDILSCFVGANPWSEVRRGEIQSASLGMASEVWNGNGRRVLDEAGELVCTQPFPSMPLGFLDDDDGERYRRAYFEPWPNVWRHGDFALETEQGGFVILGRSDAVLNPGGVRIGTAEIYRLVEQLDEVLEAVAIGQEWDGDVRVILFVVLRDSRELDEQLRESIRNCLRAGATPRHVPARIVAVPEIPRTKSGKLSELAVRDVVQGRSVANTDALANPEALRYFANCPELAE
jgi:acetoacetyl-CoA synthetase